MLHKTKGICIKFFKYKESSIIAKIYTKEFGLQSYLVHSVRTEKPKFRAALFQNLTLLEMVVYHKAGKIGLQRISEVHCRQPYLQIPFDFRKSSLALFFSELLLKTLQEEEKNEELFTFLENSFLELDQAERIDNFAIAFLLQFLEKQGLLGQDVEELFAQLHKVGACPPLNTMPTEIEALKQIRAGKPIHISSVLRQMLINHLLGYFRLHYGALGEIKSLEILRNLFA